MKGWEVYKSIKELKELGFSKRKASREAKLSRDSVDKYWDMEEEEYLLLLSESKQRGSKLDPYRGFIKEELETWSEITAAQIHDHLKEKLLSENSEWVPSRRSVQEYVAKLREEYGLPQMQKIRQYEAVTDPPFGRQAQVDMGEKTMKDVFGKSVKVYVFAMVLSNSRHKFMYFQQRPFSAADFVIAHDLAFKYYCGRRPVEMVYDQDRVMAVSENAGDLVLTEKFEEYRQYAGFSIFLCRAYDPESKGRIENVIGYIKNNFLSCRKFHGINELNSDGLAWLDRTGNGIKHETTKMVPSRVFLEEVRHMIPVPALSEPPKPSEAIVRPDNVVNYKQNRYRMPRGTYAPGRKARIEADASAGMIRFYDAKSDELLAEHILAVGVGKLVGRLTKTKPGGKAADELRLKVSLGFTEVPGADSYVDLVLEKYRRYILPQLNIFRRVQVKYSNQELTNALNYCLEHDLYSANDFRDTLVFLAQPALEIQPHSNIALPEKYKAVSPQVRDVGVYGQITGGTVR